MKVRIDRAAFAEAASWVAQVVPRNPNAAQMAGMRITAEAEQITLSGFDYETAHTATLAADVGEPGECLVSGRFLVQIIAAMSGETAELVLEPSTLNIAAGRAKYRARTMDLRGYPTLPVMPKAVGTISAARLAEAIAATEHAVGKDAAIAAMRAFNVTGAPESLTVVATDRFRVARAVSSWAKGKGKAFEVNVPASTLTTAIRGMSGNVQLGADGGLFGVSDGDRTITTRILGEADKFPDVGRLFEQKAAVDVELEPGLLVEAIKRALLVTEEHNLISVDFTEDAIGVQALSETSEGDEVVECEGNGDMTLRFDGTYLMQALAASTTGRVRVGLIGVGKQVQINPVGDETVAFIVMPRRAS